MSWSRAKGPERGTGGTYVVEREEVLKELNVSEMICRVLIWIRDSLLLTVPLFPS